MGWTVPQPAPDYEHYTSEPRDLSRWVDYGLETVNFVLSYGEPTNWLDFGAGGGELLLAARRRGVRQVVGIDLDKNARGLAANRGVEMYESLEPLGDRTFSVISASHVLEHVPKPVAMVEELRQYLSPEGLLVAVQPDPTGLLPRLAPSRWAGWMLTEHLWHFTPRSIVGVMERAGLEVLAVKRSSLDHRLRLTRALPIDLLGTLSARIGRGDQFLALARAL